MITSIMHRVGWFCVATAPCQHGAALQEEHLALLLHEPSNQKP